MYSTIRSSLSTRHSILWYSIIHGNTLPHGILSYLTYSTIVITHHTTPHELCHCARQMFFHRAWFQMRNMGHARDSISVLQGSIADWIDAGGPVEKEGTAPSFPIVNAKDLDLTAQPKYKAQDAINVMNKEEMKRIIDGDDTMTIVDVRSPQRFLGEVEEPRPGMRLGHMPGAKNVFFKDLLEDDNVNKLKPKEELETILQAGGVDTEKAARIVASCGSGVTACTLVVALEACGMDADDVFVYDGSWSEWGGTDDTPIVK
uniref:Sulfurtransferase n=1 Tax=Craspedostauros australis TaxID=1486917 RepID=A0A7R9ZSI8_9STRA|mmetsp:Transcript_8618/g.23265  ORF Transcript_8618/g.23265 Transcript_8618/m.23265 type:complete len:260 (+) Transcript_8618:918-1697(+)